MGVGGDGKLIGWESGGGSKAECRQQDDGGQREPAEAGVQGAEIGGVGEEPVGRTPRSGVPSGGDGPIRFRGQGGRAPKGSPGGRGPPRGTTRASACGSRGTWPRGHPDQGVRPTSRSHLVIAALAMGSRSSAQSGRARAERRASVVIRMASAKWCRRFPVRANVPPITPRISVATICAEPAL